MTDSQKDPSYGSEQYAVARSIALAAGELVLPAYEGSLTDLDYLRDYVRVAAAHYYGVDPSTFDSATILSTSLLRDFVHRASLQNGVNPLYADLLASGEATVQFDKDVAAILRYPSAGLCSLLADQLFDVYRAFGYQTTLVNLINGEVGSFRTGTAYSQSHSTTEVCVEDLGKSIIQDATINGLVADNGEFLSMYGTRAALQHSDPQFDTFDVYFYRYYGLSDDLLLPAPAQESLFDSMGGLPLSWRHGFGEAPRFGTWSMFPYAWQAHTGDPAPGTTFADEASALASIEGLGNAGESWQSASGQLRADGLYVSGFRLLAENGSVASSWLTIRLTDGSYVSIDFGSGQTLAGSYDQLLIEAVGKGAVRNPGVDLSFLLSPIIVLSHDGKLGLDWIADDFPVESEGGAGADVLIGTQWLDHMSGAAGNDTFYVGNAGDRVFESAGGGYDTVITNVSYKLVAGQEVELLRTWGSATTAAINLTGNEFAQTLVGNAAANALNGAGGADLLYGYAGADTFYVDDAGDRVFESVGGGYDTVITNATHGLAAGQEVELLRTYGSATTAAIDLTGNEFANTIVGNGGANVLDGKGGADGLYGYGGADTFAFTSALGAGNVDTIANFQPGLDKIALDDALFGGLPLGALASGAFRSGAAAQDADDRILYNPATGALYFDPDGIGGADAVRFAMLQGTPVIALGDFLVI